MLIASKIPLIIAGILLIIDSILMATGIPNPLLGWPLPCPITIFLLGLGIILFAFGSKVFKKA
jgi:hypothetical protein